MPIFVYEGTNPQGRRVTGELEARNIQGVFNALKTQRIVPNVKKIKEKGKGLDKELTIPGFGPRVSQKDVVIFTRQFATMIDAGLPIVQGLDILGKQNPNKALRKTLIAIKESIESGSTLAESMSKHPKVFDELFTNMILAGENGGILDVILERLAFQLEKSAKLKREVQTALIYPAVVVGAATIVTGILLIFVIPTFAELFSDFGAALPLPTQIVINMSNFLVGNLFTIFATIVLTVFLSFRFAGTPRGREVLHPIYLRLPVFGDIIRKVAVARFTRTLGTMVSSGVPILDALQICSKTAGNFVVEREVQTARIAISEGKSIVEPLEDSVVFPPMVI